MTEIPKQRRVRADALRNREHILNAVVDLLVEEGPTVALETIARRAGVGIATLYRHFPDRTVLLRQVAVDVLRQSARAAKAALAEEPDAFTALARYLHEAIDIRIGVVMPVLHDRVLMDDELNAAREASQGALAAVVKAAHDEGSLRPDVGSGDIGLLMIRMTPPLAVDISPEDNHRLSHRQLELVLDGLLRFLAVDSLPGRPLELDELGFIPRDPDGRYEQVLDSGPVRCRLTSARGVDTVGRSRTNGS
ncbi:TetR/AcrR family transcriptional regulator [Actinophytocola sp.]|uniref:TetR/AcrR family transcriptional regulator n=1 Tax=Actinophytocola sp. TaxID=1872138 RepID=UPI00389A85AD